MPRLGSFNKNFPGQTPENPIYSFSTFTFTTGGTKGPTGPAIATLLSSYNTSVNPWLNNASYFNVSNGSNFGQFLGLEADSMEMDMDEHFTHLAMVICLNHL